LDVAHALQQWSGAKLIAVFCCPAQFDDQGIVNSDSRTIAVPHDYANFIPTDIRGLTFARTPAQVTVIMTPVYVLLRAAMHWCFKALPVHKESCNLCLQFHSKVQNVGVIIPLHLCCFDRLHLVSLQACPAFVWTLQRDRLMLFECTVDVKSALWVLSSCANQALSDNTTGAGFEHHLPG